LGSALAVFSQVRLTYHRKNTIGLSRWPWLMGTSNALIGTLYSVLIADLFFLFANLAWVTANGTMLFLLFYYGRQAKPGTGANQS
jgi:hypothetical protein